MNKGLLFIISAPSGAGKTSLIEALRKRISALELSISDTTRQPRPAERNGVNYHFIDKDQFNSKVASNDYLEYATVFDHFYGTSKSAVEKQLRAGIDVIVDIDWQGARQIRSAMPESVSIFVLPPSRESLEQRLYHRGQDSDETIKRRMRDAQSEASHFDEYDYLVVNDQFERAVDDLESIVHASRLKIPVQTQRNAGMLAQLLT